MNKNEPVRLAKVEETDFFTELKKTIVLYYYENAFALAIGFTFVSILLFIALAFVICGISATESGMLRNFLIRGV